MQMPYHGLANIEIKILHMSEVIQCKLCENNMASMKCLKARLRLHLK